MLNLMGVLNATAANVSCTCNCKRYTSLQSMEISEYNLDLYDFVVLLNCCVFFFKLLLPVFKPRG